MPKSRGGLLAWAARFAVLIALIGAVPAPVPESLVGAVAAGDAALNQGDGEAAYRAFAEALQAQPADPALIRRLMRAAGVAGRPDLVAQWAALLPPTPDLYALIGDSYAAQGRLDAAAVYWARALRNTPADVPYLVRLADYAFTGREWDSAVIYLRRAASLQSLEPALMYRLGLLELPKAPRAAVGYLRIAAKEARYARLANQLRSLADQYSGPELAFRTGIALINVGEWPYAEHAFGVALAGQEIPAALALMGVAQAQQGRDGWPPINRALNTAPTDPLVNYAAGLYWRLKGETGEALAALKLAAGLDPRNPAIPAEIAETYRAVGALADAARYYAAAVNLAPDDVRLRELQAAFYADENYALDGEGLAAIQAGVRRAPNSADIAASLGYALLRGGQSEAARAEFNRALSLDPDNVRARYYFAVLLEQEGAIDAARDGYSFVAARAVGLFKTRASRALERLGG